MTRKIKPPIQLYSALADTTRCRIVEILLDGPIPVHRLADAFAISRPAISRHLRVLKTAGLVAEVKKGRENLYALRSGKLEKAVAWIDVVLTPKPPASPETTPEPLAAVPEIVVSQTAEPTSDEQSAKLTRVKKPDPINQMGFDF